MHSRAAVNVGGGVINLGLQLLAVPLAISISGIDPYGVWVSLFALAQMLVTVDLGIGAALTRVAGLGMSKELWRHTNYLFAILGVAASGVVGAIAAGLSGKFSHTLSNSGNYVLLALIACIATFVAFIGRTASSVCIGWSKFQVDRGLSVLASVIRVSILAICALLGCGILAVAIADLVFVLVPAILSHAYVRANASRYMTTYRSGRKELKSLIRTSIPFFALSMTGTAALQIQPIIVATFSTASQAGIFGICFRLLVAGRQALSWVWTPSFTSFVEEIRDRNEISPRIVAKSSVLHVGFVVAIAIPLGAFSPEILLAWTDVVSRDAEVTLRYIALFLGIMAMYMPSVAVVNAIGRQAGLAVIQIGWFFTVVIFCSLLTLSIGSIGAGAGLALATAVAAPFYVAIGTRIARYGMYRSAGFIGAVSICFVVWSIIVRQWIVGLADIDCPWGVLIIEILVYTLPAACIASFQAFRAAKTKDLI